MQGNSYTVIGNWHSGCIAVHIGKMRNGDSAGNVKSQSHGSGDQSQIQLVHSRVAPEGIVHLAAPENYNTDQCIDRRKKFENIHIKIGNIPKLAVITQPQCNIERRVHRHGIKYDQSKAYKLPVFKMKAALFIFIGCRHKSASLCANLEAEHTLHLVYSTILQA